MLFDYIREITLKGYTGCGSVGPFACTYQAQRCIYKKVRRPFRCILLYHRDTKKTSLYIRGLIIFGAEARVCYVVERDFFVITKAI